MHTGRLILLAIVLAVLRPALTAGAGSGWSAAGAEATKLLTDYVRIDTSNPPGNEARAARAGSSPASSARAAARAAWPAETAVHPISTACQPATASSTATGRSSVASTLDCPRCPAMH